MKLSIITINRNNKDGLQRTIESVVSQTFQDYEYVIIDGASTDGSVDVIKQYADKITYWVSEPDKGIYNAMNKGILQAKGEYCLFLNSGDVFASSFVMEKLFETNPISEIVTGNMLKNYPDKQTIDKGQLYARMVKNEKLTLLDFLKGTINHSPTIIKRNLFDRYGAYEESYKIVSDWIFFLKTIGLNGVSVSYVDIVISYFDMTGISNIDSELLNYERKKAIEAYVPNSILDDYQYYMNMEVKYKKIISCTCFKMIVWLYNFLFRKSIKF